MTDIKVKCIKCKGSGKLPFSVANGVCFDCDGKGYTLDTMEAIELRKVDADIKRKEYIESDEYQQSKLKEEYFNLISNIQHSNKATEWESNFAYSLNCTDRNRVSMKQKDILIKIGKKLLNDDEQIRLIELLNE